MHAASMKKKWPKNCPILTKIGMHIDQTFDYYHAKFYQNPTTLKQIIIVQSCPILTKFCVVIVKSLVYMYTNFHQNQSIFQPFFGLKSHSLKRSAPKIGQFAQNAPKLK